MDTRSSELLCFCAAPSLSCSPFDMRAPLSLSAPPVIPPTVWNMEHRRFENRGLANPPLSPSSRRAIARARLCSPPPSRPPQPPTPCPPMVQPQPPAQSVPPTAPANILSPRGEVLPDSLPIGNAPQPSSTPSTTSAASVPSRSEALSDSAVPGSMPHSAPAPSSDPLAAATAILNVILSSPSEPPAPSTRKTRLVLPPNLPEAAAESLEREIRQLGTSLALAIDDAPSWDAAERAMTAFPSALYRLVCAHVDRMPTLGIPKSNAPSSTARGPRLHHPPPVTRHHVEHRMESALSSLSDMQRSSTATHRSLYRARRKLGRLQKAWAHIEVRRMFVPNESGHRFVEILRGLPPPDFSAQVLTDISIDDIEDALNRANLTSAPGLDGIPYRIYFRFRLALLPLLHTIFNRCWSSKRIPAPWKTSVTQLVYKKGDAADVSNWRPLALQTTLYKLYASIVKARFSLWLESNERLSNSQKGFRSFNGCHEHNFLAQSLLDTSRRTKSSFFAVWYDLRNAFGAMPHDFLWLVLSLLGVPGAFLDLLKDIYTDASTIISTPNGTTPPIRQLCGVFQGCPLSPLLFIAGMTPLINALDAQAQLHGIKIAPDTYMSTTAFADDVKIFSAIRALHDTVLSFLDWSTMAANPAKCAFLPVTYSDSRQTSSPLTLAINGTPLPQLSLTDSYAYLGVREGFDFTHTRFQLDAKLHSMRQQVTALVESPLAPWQIIKALKVYVFSQLDYAIRHVKAPVSQLKSFSSFVNKSLRHLLRLPITATNEFFCSPPSSGGLGLLPMDELRDASVVAHAFQMLHSPDDTIQHLAREQLRSVIHKRYIVDPSALKAGGDLLLQRYLNGTLHEHPIATIKTHHADTSSIWSDLQAALRRYNLKFRNGFALRLPHMQKDVTPNQGRTALLHGREGSKFLLSGCRLWDADIRFAVSARLNQIDTRSVLKRRRLRANASCRHCGSASPETLGHVLQCCSHNEANIRARHDLVLQALASSIRNAQPDTRLLVNSTAADFAGPVLKPDLQLIDATKKAVVICDLAVAMEDDQLHDGETVFEKTAKHKMTKYSPLSRHYTNQGYEVYSCALVYGSLGSVAPANHNILTQVIRLSRPAAASLQYAISASVIKASRLIWRVHCSGHAPASQGTRSDSRMQQG
ncbi:hypothetical protein Ae201684P_019292 [Aphanomyces euteiches]|nr:hypothetical protein Ae201684P_019292 [Aphanomyces euteiches]